MADAAQNEVAHEAAALGAHDHQLHVVLAGQIDASRRRGLTERVRLIEAHLGR